LEELHELLVSDRLVHIFAIFRFLKVQGTFS